MSSIVTNVAALNGNRNLNITNMKMGKVLEKLSSGYRINRAADDAAGLGISEKMRAQIKGNSQAIRNAQDGISLTQTGEGALNEVSNILVRLRELAIQSANGSSSAADRNTINEEFDSLISEIDRIARSTDFNGVKLLDGSASSVDFQVGINTSPSIDVLSVTLTPALATNLGLSTVDVGSNGDTSFAIGQIDSAINAVSTLPKHFGDGTSKFWF